MVHIILEGKIVSLRLLNEADAALTLRWRLGARAQFLNKGAQNIKEQEAWICKSSQNGDLNFMIQYNGNDVGMISLYEINHTHKSLIMGRLLIGEPEAVGKAPVVFEAERLVMDYAFETLKMHSIYGDVMANNIGVNKMRRFLHWHKDGVIREHFCVEGKYVDAVLYSILCEDYYNDCRKILNNMVEFFEKNIKGDV